MTIAGPVRPVTVKYYLYQAAVSVGFITPIFTLFFLDRGLSYTAISLLSGIYGVVTIVGELPTGYLSDRVDRRTGLFAGSACTAVSVLGFAFVSGFGSFVVLYVLWGLGLAFRSGTGDAWLYDALADDGGAGAFTRVRGRGGAVNQAVTLGGMLAGGMLFAIRPELPFLAAGLLNAASLLVIASFPRNGGAADGDRSFTVSAAVAALKRQFTRAPLRGFVVGTGLVVATGRAATVYVQPIATEVVGIPVESLGGLYAGMTVAAVISSGTADRVRARLGAPRAVVGFGFSLAILLVLPVALPTFAVIAFLALYGTGAAIRPIASGFISDSGDAIGRATVLSAASLVYALFRLPLVLASGVIADAYGPLAAFGFLGVVCGGGLAVASVSLLAMSDPQPGRGVAES